MELGRVLDEARQARPRVRIGRRLPGDADELLDPDLEEGVDQRLTVGEAPVDGPDPHPCPFGDLVEADLKSALGEQVGRGVEDSLPVALRVRSERALGFCVSGHL